MNTRASLEENETRSASDRTEPTFFSMKLRRED